MLRIITYNKDIGKDCIYFSVSFEIDDDEHIAYKHSYETLSKFYKISVYKEPSYSSPSKTMYVHGANMIHIENNIITFSEYFTRCGPVLAIIKELEIICLDLEYSQNSTREFYFIKLLESLSNFWD